MKILLPLVVFALECIIIGDAAASVLTTCLVKKGEKIEKINCNPDKEKPKKVSDNSCDCGHITRRLKKNPYHLIIHGNAVQPSNKYPWMVSLETKWGEKLCGGAIINEYYILTAAHCLLLQGFLPDARGVSAPREGKISRYKTPIFGRMWNVEDKALRIFAKPEDMAVAFLTSGSNTERRSDVAEVIPHEEYDFLHHDIGLLKMKEKIKCDEFARPICLPKGDEQFMQGTKLTVSGWGLTNPLLLEEPDGLQELKLTTLSFEKCSEASPEFSSLDGTYYCVIGVNKSSACYGDSGSSMFKKIGNKAHAIGIASMLTKEGCPVKTPMVFTSISAYMPWIKEKIK